MNIKNRIRKIETRAVASSFCECLGRKTEVVYLEDGKPATSPEFLNSRPEPIPNICGECAKPINKTTIIVDFTDDDCERSV